jgi:hypothetical protein
MSNQTIHPTVLAAKVAARNRLNAELNRVDPLLNEAFKPFLGKKIIKADSTLTEAAKAVIPMKYEHGCGLAFYHDRSEYALHFRFYCDEIGDRGNSHTLSTRAEHGISVGTIEGQVLKSLWPVLSDRRTDYSVAEIAEARKEIAELKAELSEAEQAISGFGEHDSY